VQRLYRRHARTSLHGVTMCVHITATIIVFLTTAVRAVSDSEYHPKVSRHHYHLYCHSYHPKTSVLQPEVEREVGQYFVIVLAGRLKRKK